MILLFWFESLGNGISADQYAFQVSTGFILGAKGEFATGGFNKAYGRGRPSNSRQITKMIYNGLVYSPATNLLNKAYDKATK